MPCFHIMEHNHALSRFDYVIVQLEDLEKLFFSKAVVSFIVSIFFNSHTLAFILDFSNGFQQYSAHLSTFVHWHIFF